MFWKKKTKLNWFVDGDRNTSLFFMLWLKKEGDLILEDFEHIEDCILDFYKNLYVVDDSVFGATPALLS